MRTSGLNTNKFTLIMIFNSFDERQIKCNDGWKPIIFRVGIRRKVNRADYSCRLRAPTNGNVPKQIV